MFFELREYRIAKGQMGRWVNFMEDKLIPFQISKGMVVVGSFISLDDPDVYVWIRRFESREECDRLYKEVYESETWEKEIGPVAMEMLDFDTMKVTRLEATPKSVIH